MQRCRLRKATEPTHNETLEEKKHATQAEIAAGRQTNTHLCVVLNLFGLLYTQGGENRKSTPNPQHKLRETQTETAAETKKKTRTSGLWMSGFKAGENIELSLGLCLFWSSRLPAPAPSPAPPKLDLPLPSPPPELVSVHTPLDRGVEELQEADTTFNVGVKVRVGVRIRGSGLALELGLGVVPLPPPPVWLRRSPRWRIRLSSSVV